MSTATPAAVSVPTLPAPAQPETETPAEPVTRDVVSSLIDRGKVKSALAQAKAFHRQAPSGATEALLVKAYVARVRSFPAGMGTEALSLLDLTCERFPAARDGLARIRPQVLARHGWIDELVQPLADENCPAATRKGIEDALRQEATDLEAIAATESLPAGHSLRAGAAAAWAAFEAVTTRPVTDAEIALPQISRRSPLAAWKLLIRAIAGLYRGDSAACEAALAAIDPHSAPSRLVPAMRTLLADRGGAVPENGAANELIARVTGRSERLRKRMEALDAAFAKENRTALLRAVHAAIRECERSRPDLLERLKQQISVRCTEWEIPLDRLRAALGGPSLHDARFWRLWARSAERRGDPITACSLWQEFRRNAINEKRIGEVGAAAAAIDLHMTDLLSRVPPELLKDAQRQGSPWFHGYASCYEDQPAQIRRAAPIPGPPDLTFVHPDRLFRRACAADPQPRNFRRWLEWARRDAGPKAAEAAALAWHTALPGDPAPLLFLIKSCEGRGALKKAVGFLNKAEALESLDPEVRRARPRLLASCAIRHLAARQLHLLRKDLLALGALPRAAEGSWPVLVAGLHWVSSRIKGNDESKERFKEVARLLGSRLAATGFCLGLAKLCRLDERVLSSLSRPNARPGAGELAAAAARACALGRELGLAIGIPDSWSKRLLKDLSAGSAGLDTAACRQVAEAALRDSDVKLAYAAAGCGLAQSDAFTARFLLLRAQSLPPSEAGRREDCLAAAAALARRERDMELVAEIVEAAKEPSGPWGGGLDEPLSPVEVTEVLRRERKTRRYPRPRPVDREPLPDTPCDCPICRGARSETEQVFLPEEDEIELAIPPELEKLPPEIRSLMIEALLKHATPGGELPDIEELRLVDPDLFARMERAMARYVDSGGSPAFVRRGSNRTKPRKKRKNRKRRRARAR